ncbi:hypothetical protein [Hyphomicrobium sp.]|uniref:hypothetical protein n=1 Tax=Hyphomicrobium sp. TaxID=82 RepID=UPI001D2B6C23|nr:hypothetical protein [Hyphomicrobium sp.]MBY0560281.1 hypothetical protein [Hyphomicrobium sp.]
MLKFLGVASFVLGLATLVPSADAHFRHRCDGCQPFRLGYHRYGPPYGPHFGFYTYAGDPFARDDYYDGRRCYYLHHRSFCRGPRPLDWLRFR